MRPTLGVAGLAALVTGCGLILDLGALDAGQSASDADVALVDATARDAATRDAAPLDATPSDAADVGCGAEPAAAPHEMLTGVVAIAETPPPDPMDTRGGLAPAGVQLIIGSFTNTSTTTFVDVHYEVTTLPADNLLLNADGGPGGVGSRLSMPNGALGPDCRFTPAETITQTFEIGLGSSASFRFLVDMYARPLR